MVDSIKKTIPNKIPIIQVEFDIKAIRSGTSSTRHGGKSSKDLPFGHGSNELLNILLRKSGKIIRNGRNQRINRECGCGGPKVFIKIRKTSFNITLRGEDVTRIVLDTGNLILMPTHLDRVVEKTRI